MTRHTIRGALLAAAFLALPSIAGAQQGAHADHSAHHAQAAQHHVAPAGAHAMKTPCPLHLTTLRTTPAQDSAIARIREAHMAEMKAMHAGHAADSSQRHMADPAARERMKTAMRKALDDMRAVLDESQRQQLDAAVAAHEAEKAELAKSGTAHDCAGCCAMHEQQHGGAGAAHHEH